MRTPAGRGDCAIGGAWSAVTRPNGHASNTLNRKELNPLNTRGMKRLSIAVLRDDTRAVVERLERAMDPMSDGGTAITPREAREALRPAKRADARAAYLHDVTAVAHALEREAITPHYIADLTTRLRSRAEELDPVPA